MNSTENYAQQLLEAVQADPGHNSKFYLDLVLDGRKISVGPIREALNGLADLGLVHKHQEEGKTTILWWPSQDACTACNPAPPAVRCWHNPPQSLAYGAAYRAAFKEPGKHGKAALVKAMLADTGGWGEIFRTDPDPEDLPTWIDSMERRGFVHRHGGGSTYYHDDRCYTDGSGERVDPSCNPAPAPKLY